MTRISRCCIGQVKMFSPVSSRVRCSCAWGRLVLFLSVALGLASVPDAMAQRNHLRPTDFEPLTSLPWKKEGATLEGVLDVIFRETNQAIRDRVLAEYLRWIPVDQLGRALDVCLAFEGTQQPDSRVEFFLPIWAARDPRECWKRTQALFHVVGFRDGWLSYDSWNGRPKITVQDLESLRASPFWLDGSALASFPLGLEQSALSKDEQVGMMKEFFGMWIAAFATWPTSQTRKNHPESFESLPDFIGTFDTPVEEFRNYTPADAGLDEFRFEIAMRRRMLAEPSAGPEIVRRVQGTMWPSRQGAWGPHSGGPSTELLMIWVRKDLPSLIRWAESLDTGKDPLALTTRAFLMSRVDARTRKRWLADAKTRDPDHEKIGILLEGWVGWDPKNALEAALATKDLEIIEEISIQASSGPFMPWLRNTVHANLGFMQHFDPARLPRAMQKDHFINWEEILETWGEVDIGETARYGVDFILHHNYASRERLLRFFSGDDEYPDTGDVIDRTFCALRVWAVARPEEMKAWIATLKDKDLRKALTWLRENPWGTETTP